MEFSGRRSAASAIPSWVASGEAKLDYGIVGCEGMGKRQALNKRRLTKADVQRLIAEGAMRRDDEPLSDMLPTQSYDLPGDRVLVVFVGDLLNGKGDIYPRDSYLRSLAWGRRVERDRKRGILSSGDRWAYYTHFKDDFVAHVPELLARLPAVLGLDAPKMDLSYASLDLISPVIERCGVDEISERAHDELVAYVGEILRLRLGGRWAMASKEQGGYPYVSLPGDVQAMPINVVQEIMGPGVPDVRAATTSESRRAALESRIRSGLPFLDGPRRTLH